jgi:hypothetical protein
MAHYEILFPTNISYGVRGGPAWKAQQRPRATDQAMVNASLVIP